MFVPADVCRLSVVVEEVDVEVLEDESVLLWERGSPESCASTRVVSVFVVDAPPDFDPEALDAEDVVVEDVVADGVARALAAAAATPAATAPALVATRRTEEDFASDDLAAEDFDPEPFVPEDFPPEDFAPDDFTPDDFSWAWFDVDAPLPPRPLSPDTGVGRGPPFQPSR